MQANLSQSMRQLTKHSKRDDNFVYDWTTLACVVQRSRYDLSLEQAGDTRLAPNGSKQAPQLRYATTSEGV